MAPPTMAPMLSFPEAADEDPDAGDEDPDAMDEDPDDVAVDDCEGFWDAARVVDQLKL